MVYILYVGDLFKNIRSKPSKKKVKY